MTNRQKVGRTGASGLESAAHSHAVDEIQKVVIVAKTTAVIELFAGAFDDVIVVPDVCVLTRPGLVRQRTQRQRTR